MLEPAAGVGHFFGLMPQDLAGASDLVGVELDSLSGRILGGAWPALLEGQVVTGPAKSMRTSS